MKPLIVFLAKICLCLSCTLSVVPSYAANPVNSVEQKLSQKLTQKLTKKFGQDAPKILSLRKTNYFGLYEFRFGRTLGYTDEKVSYILFGSVVDGTTMDDLSHARLEELNRIKFDDLPLNLAIKTVKGDGSRKMAVFADPNCGYCKKLEHELEKADNLTVYVFLYPILGDDSVEKSRNILCAADRSGTWSEWMLKDKAPESQAKCNTPLNKLMNLGKTLDVEATPTLYLEDGQRISGALPLDELENALTKARAKIEKQ